MSTSTRRAALAERKNPSISSIETSIWLDEKRFSTICGVMNPRRSTSIAAKHSSMNSAILPRCCCYPSSLYFNVSNSLTPRVSLREMAVILDNMHAQTLARFLPFYQLHDREPYLIFQWCGLQSTRVSRLRMLSQILVHLWHHCIEETRNKGQIRDGLPLPARLTPRKRAPDLHLDRGA